MDCHEFAFANSRNDDKINLIVRCHARINLACNDKIFIKRFQRVA